MSLTCPHFRAKVPTVSHVSRDRLRCPPGLLLLPAHHCLAELPVDTTLTKVKVAGEAVEPVLPCGLDPPYYWTVGAGAGKWWAMVCWPKF